MILPQYVIRFSNVTKYDLRGFLNRYKEFFDEDYSYIDDYFAGAVETLENDRLKRLQNLLRDCRELQSQFKNYANRFSDCGYWLLMEWIDDLVMQVEKTLKLPKYYRTTLTARNYKPVIQVDTTVGSQRTMEDVATAIQSTGASRTTWEELMTGNDLEEDQWEIDKLTPVTALVNNQLPAAVTTILEAPVGVQVYGKDIRRKITIKVEDRVTTKTRVARERLEVTKIIGDLDIVAYADNLDQKVMILMGMRRGSVPEYPLLGIDAGLSTGNTAGSVSFPMIQRQQVDTFMQDDLFEYVAVTDIDQTQSDSYILTMEIKTKYDSKVTKKVKI